MIDPHRQIPLSAPLEGLIAPPLRADGELPVDGEPENRTRTAQGIAASPGVAIGPVYVYSSGVEQRHDEALEPEDLDREQERFESAVARSERELQKISLIAEEKLGGASADIFEAQLLMLRDSALYEAVCELIREERLSAGFAVERVLEKHRRRMEASGSVYLRERATDLLDVQTRLLRNLQQARASSRVDSNHIVVAQNLTAADVLLFSRRGTRGIVIDYGGATSHVSIMARALGVPAVVSLHGFSESVQAGDELIIDGFNGRVILHPDAPTRQRFQAKRKRYESLLAERESLIGVPAETRDGQTIVLRANMEFESELPLLAEYGASGIGLFRTELHFLAHGRALNEDEQVTLYKKALAAAGSHSVTFRLIDLGGDKVLPLSRREPNPFLGWRGIRILLDRPEILMTQLRAVLRAAAGAPDRARLLIPMVTNIGEVLRVRRLLHKAAEDLAREGVQHAAYVPLGIMVEVPAVAMHADRFIEHCDFFSIGTNDLTQFTLAVDRGNDLVASHYREVHPAVMALIKTTVDAARAAGKDVSICGEIAGNPLATALLVGLGIREFSASPTYLLDVKRVIRSMTTAEAEKLAARALEQPDADSAIRILHEWLTDHDADLAQLLELQILPPGGDTILAREPKPQSSEN
ncbi:phosphoenolpyruvate--protein phosphotransferase [soil metagenome]